MKKMNIRKIDILLYIATISIVLFGDQLSKIIVSSSMQLNNSQTIIPDFFYFTYTQNIGAAWSMLEGHVSLFVIIACVASIGMVFYFTKTKKEEVLTRFGLVLAFSGALGNLIDRIYFGYVRDFLDFVIFGYDFPVFNIADMALFIGVGLIILEILLEEFYHGKKANSN